jgi:LytS/YehU family sensor histidine kinase
MKWLQYFVLPVCYLLAGGFVSVWLMRPLIESAGTGWFFVLLPLVLVTLMITTMGLVGVWVHYQTWTHEGLMRPYTTRQLWGLYVRCFACLTAGCLLAAVIYLLTGLLPASVRGLVEGWCWTAYALCAVLTAIALLSIVRGESLQEIRWQQAQSENFWLRSQLNPHFLYNTLNNIDALVWLDQERASESINRLSGLMRYLTESAKHREVSVGEEVQLLHQLVELQRLRMPSAESLTLSVDVDDPQQRIAPLLLMPLVENTFKHVGDLTQPNAIVIHLILHEKRLLLTTDNSMRGTDQGNAPSRKNDTTGTGLRVLRRRLQLLYPGRHRCVAYPVGNRFHTELSIQLGEK